MQAQSHAVYTQIKLRAMSVISDKLKDQIAWILVFICPAFFASNMLIARGMAGIFPPLAMAFFRWFFVGLIVVIALCLLRSAPLIHWRREWRQILFLSSLGMGLCGGPVYLAGELTTATNIGLIYSAAPLLIALLAFLFFKETLNAVQMTGMVMGLMGVLIIIIKADLAVLAHLTFNQGDLLIVMATMAFSVYSLGLKYSQTSLTQIQRFGAMALGGALWHAPFVIYEWTSRGAWPEFTSVIVSALLVLVFSASLGAYLSYSFIVSRLGATIAGSTLYLSPIYAASLAMLLLGETISDYHIIGGALILPGLWCVSQRTKPTKDT